MVTAHSCGFISKDKKLNLFSKLYFAKLKTVFKSIKLQLHQPHNRTTLLTLVQGTPKQIVIY